MNTFEFDVFLSHHSRDKAEVIQLKEALMTRGIRGWLDKDELPPGRNWIKLLEAGLASSKAVAACVGPSGIGPWHDEEIQAALQQAVRAGKPVIPVLLPGSGNTPELPLFLGNRMWVDCRSGFTPEALDALEWGITGIRPAKAGTRSGGTSVTESEAPRARADTEETEHKLREVFGTQFERLKALFENNQPFRDLLVERFGVRGLSSSWVTLALMVQVHLRFTEAIGAFAQIYRNSPHKAAVIDLVSTVMYLAMCPDYAKAIRERGKGSLPGEIRVNPEAREGIGEMLVCWSLGNPTVPVQDLSTEKAFGIMEATPQMTFSEIKLAVMDKLGIDPTKPDAEALLERTVRLDRHFGTPVCLSIEERSLSDEIRAPGSPLKDLLLFIRMAGQSIHPNASMESAAIRANFDADIEACLKRLKTVFSNP